MHAVEARELLEEIAGADSADPEVETPRFLLPTPEGAAVLGGGIPEVSAQVGGAGAGLWVSGASPGQP
ncbi:hypothetical protein NDU88_000031 [Pleurodeles waltl]|uniref:Uncharacterized protein n=1 Tax=Pleurodeles waltl TaxID=8319 RepID=A0AAV7KLF0_PLEWA|nr:hypothetical protein NDU88_000031 [Pleurodeles waltl]